METGACCNCMIISSGVRQPDVKPSYHLEVYYRLFSKNCILILICDLLLLLSESISMENSALSVMFTDPQLVKTM